MMCSWKFAKTENKIVTRTNPVLVDLLKANLEDTISAPFILNRKSYGG